MKRFYLVILGLLSVCFGVAAETDTRTVVTEVIATTTPGLADIIGCGKERKLPAFTISEGTGVRVSSALAPRCITGRQHLSD